VLYSLTSRLESSHLKQLPDIGANHTPPSLRKDMWRPLWRVQFQDTPHSKQQALHAFKKLREWRKLHELCWKPSEEMRRPFTEIQIEKLQSHLDQRGGSKKETVYDLIKRHKRKMRVRIIRDQKANSVADLAAVLKEQAELGLATQPNGSPHDLKLTDVHNMIKLARQYANPKEQTRMNEKITKLQEELATMQQQLDTGDAEAKKTPLRVIQEKQKSLESIERHLSKMQWCAKAVAKAEDKATRDGKDHSEHVLATYLPQTFPETPTALRLGLANARRNPQDAPRRGWVAAEIRRRLQPRFEAKGIRISWFNELDAEFAKEWPQGVEHTSFHDLSSHNFVTETQPQDIWSKETISSEQNSIEFPSKTKIAAAIQDLSLQSVRRKAVQERWNGLSKIEYWKSKGDVVDLDGSPSRFARRFRDKFQRQRVQVAAGLSQ